MSVVIIYRFIILEKLVRIVNTYKNHCLNFDQILQSDIMQIEKQDMTSTTLYFCKREVAFAR